MLFSHTALGMSTRKKAAAVATAEQPSREIVLKPGRRLVARKATTPSLDSNGQKSKV